MSSDNGACGTFLEETHCSQNSLCSRLATMKTPIPDAQSAADVKSGTENDITTIQFGDRVVRYFLRDPANTLQW